MILDHPNDYIYFEKNSQISLIAEFNKIKLNKEHCKKILEKIEIININ